MEKRFLMYATWNTYQKVTDQGNKRSMLGYKDPGFGTNSGLPSGDSSTFDTSTPWTGIVDRVVTINIYGSVHSDGQYARNRFGARPALSMKSLYETKVSYGIIKEKQCIR